jgi:uncharacterized protein (TIGR02271 family)
MTDPAMTRSEEELRIAVSQHESGRARLVRFAETEVKSFTVPVRRERVRIEYGPAAANAANPAAPGRDPAPAGERWLVLYDEEVVVQKRWVARERVRLVVRSLTGDHPVSADLRREEIAVDDTHHGG